MQTIRATLAGSMLAILASLAACGGGGGDGDTDEPAQTRPGMALVGDAGGTVTGADGASVVVPSGALKARSTVTIAIAKSAAGAPVEPPSEGFLPVSNVFTITPHGHGFAEPVRVTLPFDASLVRDGDQLLILKAQPYGKWVAHSEVTRDGAMATLEVRDFSTFMVVIRPAMRIRPAPAAPAPTPFSFTVAVSGTAPNLTITYTFSGTRPTCVEGDRLETVFMAEYDDSYHDSVLGLPRHSISRTELLALTVPTFSPPAAPLAGNTLTHVVIQPPHATGGDYYGDGTLTVSPYVKGRYTCTSERLANNAVAAPWTLESANWGQLPFNGSNVALLGDIADVATSVGAPVVSRARAQAPSSSHLLLQSKWEISRDSGATWSLYKLGAERAGTDTSFYSSEAAAQAAGLWTIEGDLPPFAATDSGALLRFSACAFVASFHWADPPLLKCAAGTPRTVSVAFLEETPSFSVMPAPMAVMAGAGASFSVVTAGLPTPTLKWQRRLPRGAWEDVAGATGPTHNLAATTLGQDGTQFRAVATNASGSVTSALATLNVVDQASPPAITAVSGPLTVTRTGTAVFAATVKGTEPMSFQWRRNGADVLGANTPILRLDNVGDEHAGSYVLHVDNPAGAVQTAAQQLTVVAEGTTLPTAPTIVTQPVAVRVNAGNTATFAVGAGGSGPLAYQWMRDNVDIPGATAAFYSIAAVVAGNTANYAVVVSNGAGSVTSASAALAVDAAMLAQAPVITAQPGAVVVAPGMNAMLGVGVQGSGPMSFQWLKNGVAVVGQTQATYAIAAASALDAGAYQVRVSNSVGEVTSATVQLILLGSPAIATQPSNRSVNEGASATFSVTASGDHLRYQWMRNQVAIAGATGASHATPALTLADSGAVYGVIVYNGAGLVFSEGAVLTVTAAPVAPQWQGALQMRDDDGNTAARAVVAAGGSGEFVAVWLDTNALNVQELRASRYRPAEGRWSAVDTVAIVTYTSGATLRHAVAMNAAGNAVVVFTSQHNSRQSIWESRQGPTGGWSTPQLLEGEDGGHAELPAVAIDAQGTATAVWQQNDTVFFPNMLSTRRIVTSQALAGFGFSPAGDIDFVAGANGTSLDIYVATSPTGDVVAAWTTNNAVGQVAAANVMRRGSGWIGAQLLVADTTSGTASNVRGAAINDAGVALVTFRRLPSTSSNVFAARYTRATGWASPELLGTYGDAPTVVLGPDGTATVAWESVAGNQILVTRGSAAGVWSTPQTAGAGFGPQLGRDFHGNVTVAWLSNPGTRTVSSAHWPAGGALTSATVIESATAATSEWVAGGLAVCADGQAAAVWVEGEPPNAAPWVNLFR